MAGQPPQKTIVSKALSAMDRSMMRCEEFVLSWGVIAIAGLTIGNVISRKFFNFSWVFVDELCQVLMVWITFLGIGYAVRKGRHIRMSAVYDMMPPKVRKVLMVVILFTTALLMFYFSYYTLLYALKIKKMGDVLSATRLPIYLILLWVPVGFVIAGCEYLMGTYRNLTAPDVYLSYEKKDEYEVETPASLSGDCFNTPQEG